LQYLVNVYCKPHLYGAEAIDWTRSELPNYAVFIKCHDTDTVI